VSRALMTMKMSNSYAFDEDANKFLHSYLTGRSQCVRTGE
jgi:hypothetical protein